MKLRDMGTGDLGRVVRYDRCDPGYRQKLLRMGLVRGAEFRVVRRAPLGDPVEIEIRGCHLSLRQDEACAFEVELLGTDPPTA
jgi:Fe2+ transport system protein FeoA